MKKLILPGLALIFLAATACNQVQKVQKEDNGAQVTQTATTAPSKTVKKAQAEEPKAKASDSEVLAKVNGKEITDDEVYDRVKNRLKKLESQIFDIKRSGLNNVIEEALIEAEAKKRNLSVDELLKAEVDSKTKDPSEAEIQSFYNQYKSRFNNQALEQVKDRIVRQLKSQKQGKAYDDYVSKLRKTAKVEIMMERPRAEISTEGAASLGDEDAPITIVEFSEFQCPFCKRVQGTLNQIDETYGKKVRRVFRHFPLSFHKQAPKAAEASLCAGEQDKFWDYSNKLWDNQRALQVDQLKSYAKDLKLDTNKFNECLDSGKFADQIAKDMRDGQIAGVSGTPAFFINGIFLSGARPFESFKEIIDEELARLGK